MSGKVGLFTIKPLGQCPCETHPILPGLPETKPIMIILDPDKCGINDEISIVDYLGPVRETAEKTTAYSQKESRKQVARRQSPVKEKIRLAPVPGSWRGFPYNPLKQKPPSQTIQTSTRGDGVCFTSPNRRAAVILCHSAGGGYDQGLVLAHLLKGFQGIAVSRAGHLRTPVKIGRSPARS